MKEQIRQSVGKSPRYYSKEGIEQFEGDLRRGRKEGWFPSVTTVMGVWPKTALVAWQIEQAILASLTLPRIKGEDEAAFAMRVVEDSNRERDDAAEWGREFHKRIEAFQMGVTDQTRAAALADGPTKEMADAVMSFGIWAKSEIMTWCDSEVVVVNTEYGYAGRLDFRYVNTNGLTVLADIKTRVTKPGVKPVFYAEQAAQLSAYKEASPELGIQQLQSIVVDRKTGEISTKDWTDDEAALGWLKFKACLRMWCLSHARPYYPTEATEKLCKHQ